MISRTAGLNQQTSKPPAQTAQTGEPSAGSAVDKQKRGRQAYKGKRKKTESPGQHQTLVRLLHAPVAAELATRASASTVTASAAGANLWHVLPLSVKTEGADDDRH